jgi:hypothetical protein
MRPDVLAESLGQTIRGAVSPLALRVAALETAGGGLAGELGGVRDRLAALEARAPLPGPAGPPGPPGRDGVDGKDGAGLRWLGKHVSGKTYDVGDIVQADGSAWYCGRTTLATPGHSPDWQLMVKHGRDLRGDRGDR